MSKSKLLIVAALAALALGACTGPAEPQFAALDGTQGDTLNWNTAEEEPALEDTTLIGEVDDLRVFAARNTDGEWCAVITLPETMEGEPFASMSCVASDRFLAHGAILEMSDPSREVGATVLPDNFSGELDNRWERVSDNLAVYYER
jgi:hypothetical protein